MRQRRVIREMSEKINIMIDAQIRNDEKSARFAEMFAKNDERFAKNDERFAKFDERCARYDVLFAKHDERFAKFDARFKELGQRTDKTLEILMRLVRERQNGGSENPANSKH